MKSFTRSSSLWLLPVLALVAAPGLVRADQLDNLEVGVRSRVMDGKAGKEVGGRHPKIYGILSVEIIKQPDKLVRPVDARLLYDQVKHELNLRGFTEPAKGAKPQILITVQYGRSWLSNPFLGGAQYTEMPSSDGGRFTGGESNGGGPGSGPPGATRTVIDEAPIQTISMADAGLVMRLHENGVEAKVQKAEAEKLCIIVTAWPYPAKTIQKPKRLWITTMVVDDPEHRDLNLLSGEMLAAGSAYFDAVTKEEEDSVFRPVPNGQVEVGTPTVVKNK
ncbi:MAG: hypothetical protein JWM32_1250 [Verrucomicrobia bacterium]|nr:hypothetical protein [Verrucomicrobiota bacterium]